MAASSVAYARSNEGWGSEVAALPWIGEIDPADLARAMFTVALPGVSRAMTVKRQAQLVAAARRIDFYSRRRGAWVEYAAVVINSWREGGRSEWLSEPPRSLGALALELRREANWRRYGGRLRKRTHLRPLAGSRERQKVKKWRATLRQLEAESPGSGRGLRRPRDL